MTFVWREIDLKDMVKEIPKINFLAIALAREYVIQNNQPEAVERFQALLTPEEKKIFFDSKGTAFNFVDEKIFFDVLSKYNSFRHSVNLSAVTDVARYTGKNVTPKIWSGFLKKGDFAVIISGAGFAWRSMHTQGNVQTELMGISAANLTLTGGCKNLAHCEYIRGFILGMSDMFENIKSCAVTEIACELQGAPQCKYAISWIKKKP